MRTAKQIREEIVARFGFFPPFFGPALNSPSILENLWQQTLSAYVENPLPALFKEQFAAIAARSCKIPYCLVCHSCTLRPLGMKAGEVLDLLEKWHPVIADEKLDSLAIVSAQSEPIEKWPDPGSPLETAILHLSLLIFSGEDESLECASALRRILNEEYFNFLTLFIAYNKTCLAWAELHPELSFEADRRAQENLEPLLKEEPRLAEFYKNYKTKYSESLAKGKAQGKIVELEKFKILAEAIPQLCWIAEPDGFIYWYNQRWYNYTGTTPKDMEGWGWKSVHDQELLPSVMERWQNSIRTGEQFEMEFPLRSVGGQFRWFLTRVIPVRDSKNAITNWFGTNTDIHAQKQAMDAAHHAERRLSTFFKSAPMIIWATDKSGVVTLSEGKGLASLGLKPGEAVGWDLINRPESTAESVAHVKRALAGESFDAVTSFGEKVIETQYEPMRDPEGMVSGIVAISNDITESKRLETALRASELAILKTESKFRKVYESKMFGMLSWDKAGAISETNDAFLKMIGYTRSEQDAVRLSWKEMTPPEYAELDAQAVDQTIANGYCEPYEKEFIRKDGSRVAVIISGATIQGEEKIGGIAIVLDVSSKRKAEQERAESILNERAALHASKTKSQFLANMSHEIRTPINGVIGMTGMILDTPLSEEQRDYANSIRYSAESLLTVINDILDFSKVEAGKLELEEVDFSLDSSIRHTVKSLSFLAQKKGLVIDTEIDEDLPPYLKGDSGRLGQILNNLIGNALKFTSSGQVLLRVRRENETKESIQIRFEVQDSGIGIPEAALGKLFQVFSQADPSTTRKFGGTGLGLSISKRLVELLGGTIGVRSKEGSGSTFWFTAIFKVGQAPVENEPEFINASCENNNHFKLKRILVAEDNIINQKITLKMLEKLGYRADVAANGREVLHALQAFPYDLILMDCQMPEMDGYQATRAIRKSDTLKCKNIAIVAMTANAMKEDRDRCLEAGMDGYISKPISLNQLGTAIKKWLEESKDPSAKAAS